MSKCLRKFYMLRSPVVQITLCVYTCTKTIILFNLGEKQQKTDLGLTQI